MSERVDGRQRRGKRKGISAAYDAQSQGLVDGTGLTKDVDEESVFETHFFVLVSFEELGIQRC